MVVLKLQCLGGGPAIAVIFSSLYTSASSSLEDWRHSHSEDPNGLVQGRAMSETEPQAGHLLYIINKKCLQRAWKAEWALSEPSDPLREHQNRYPDILCKCIACVVFCKLPEARPCLVLTHSLLVGFSGVILATLGCQLPKLCWEVKERKCGRLNTSTDNGTRDRRANPSRDPSSLEGFTVDRAGLCLQTPASLMVI